MRQTMYNSGNAGHAGNAGAQGQFMHNKIATQQNSAADADYP